MSNSNHDIEFGKRLFSIAKEGIPNAPAIFKETLVLVLDQNENDPAFIKSNFSSLVADCQSKAYEIYLSHESKACGAALKKVAVENLPENPTANDVLDFYETAFGGIDKFCLSLTQSRRPRAGKTFEMTVTSLFEQLGYPYTEQPDLGDSKPDYILPSVDWYDKYAGDCIIFTCKRTLRERWRQIVTEGGSGQSFFLATIDEKLSRAELQRMQDRRVIVVVPELLKVHKYNDVLNVISFEIFFEHHLDPALIRWQSQDAI